MLSSSISCREQVILASRPRRDRVIDSRHVPASASFFGAAVLMHDEQRSGTTNCGCDRVPVSGALPAVRTAGPGAQTHRPQYPAIRAGSSRKVRLPLRSPRSTSVLTNGRADPPAPPNGGWRPPCQTRLRPAGCSAATKPGTLTSGVVIQRHARRAAQRLERVAEFRW